MATSSAAKAGSVRSLAPGLDIFKTPENLTFYSANLYQSLDERKQEIRLIELSGQTGDDDILECKLLPATLLTDARKQYLALSYCAGDPEDTKEIMVNGVRCNIFANLHHALVLTRRYWIQSSRQGPLRLWIDQLCINQHDLKERSHQVGFMRDIYQSAERTLACVSTSKASGEGLKWFNDLCDALSFQEDDVQEDDEPLQYDREDELGIDEGATIQEIAREVDRLFDTSESKLLGGRPKNLSPLQYYLLKHVGIDKFVNGWMAFYDFISSPWWNRAWICQEFMISEQVSFLFGYYSASWERCWKNLQEFCDLHSWFLISRSFCLTFLGPPKDGPEDRKLCHILDTVDQRDLNRQIDHVQKALEMKICWRGGIDIKVLLSHSRSCRTSDDRDRVYAMLGLASPGYQMFPDYSRDTTAAQVMIATTKAIIDKEDSLYILVQATTLVGSRNLDLPSWVVDWSGTEHLDTQNNHYGERLFNQMSCEPQESPQHKFETIKDTSEQTKAHILRVYGTFITEIWLDTREWPFAGFIAPLGWRGGGLASITDGDELWILQGLRVPIVLRPYRDGYQVISKGFILGPDDEGFGTPVISAEEARARRSRIVLY